MIKSCFDNTYMIDEYPIYYELEGEKILIARYKALTKKDVNMAGFELYGDGDIENINLHLSLPITITKSLVWWVFDEEITVDNLLLLSSPIQNTIIESISNFISGYNGNNQAYYDNIRLYIELMENEQNRKHVRSLINNHTVTEKACKHCLLHDTCNRQDKPVILPITSRAVQYAYKYINSNGALYIDDTNIENHPVYLVSFVDYAIKTIMDIRESNSKSDTQNNSNKQR